MYGDFSRLNFANARRRHYASVLLQQGRVHLDADWNELVALTASRSETTMTDVIGKTGAPKRNAGFQILRSGNSFSVSEGRYYVDGVLVENDELVSYEGQAEGIVLPDISSLLAEGETGIVYLDVSKEDVSALEDINLREPALGGPDTTTRQKIAWHVGFEPLSDIGLTIDEITTRAEQGLQIWLPGTGLMAAGTSVPDNLADESDCLLPPEAGYLSQDNLLYRIEIQRGGSRNQARFKWSRENGSVLALLDQNNDSEFILRGDLQDDVLGFQDDIKVEVFDDSDRHLGRAGVLRQMRRQADGTVTFTGGLGRVFADLVNPRVRRWDQSAGSNNNGLSLNSASIGIENGIEIAFQQGDYRSGDYWLIPARAATGSILWEQDGGIALGGDLATAQSLPSFGWGRRRVPLAIIQRSGNGISGQVTDLRPLFPSLTQLEAVDVRYNNSVCDLDANNIQQALEALCTRNQGHCSVFVSNVAELLTVSTNIGNARNLHLCLAEGDYILAAPLVFSGLNHLRITGAGPETLITASRSEAAIVINDCRRVEVLDLRTRGQNPNGAFSTGRRGAITITGSTNVLIERIDSECSWAELRGQSCLSIYARGSDTHITIRDSHFLVGQGQIGLQITDPRRVIVENNIISAIAPNGRALASRFARDTLLLRRIVAGAIALPVAQGTDRTDRGVIMRGIRQPVSVISRVGNAQVDIVVHPDLAAPIAGYMRARGNNLSIGGSIELYKHLQKTLAKAIRENGNFQAGGTRVRQFNDFVSNLTGRTSPYCEEGIVIAGASIGEVQIRSNDIRGAIYGIRVAASDRTNPNPPNWKSARPVNSADRVIIENNTLQNNPTAPTRVSNGILVGHFASLIIKGNNVSFQSSTANTDTTYWMGIQVYGWRGILMRIVENVIENARTGVSVRPSIGQQSGRHWDLEHNAYLNVTQQIDVSGGSINLDSDGL